ncbi:MAG: hypothetical protein KDL87_17435 [Verrucomicrobiae bacterium]|nr:hypothetical protein [Verrucomicrobiae bacterium]
MKKSQSRHGVRADGKTQTSISLRGDLLAAAKKAAGEENRSLSNWLENLLSEKLGPQAPRPRSKSSASGEGGKGQ